MDYTGKKFMQKCGDFLIIDKKSNKKIRNRYYWEAHFEGYDRILYVRTDSFKGGTVGNPDKPDEYGFLCDVTDVDKKTYFIWKDMEKRCYDSNCPEYKYYGLLGVVVSEEFKKYSFFHEWYIKNCNDDFSLELDKDCLSGNNKIYSPDTCILIPGAINSFLSTLGKGIYTTKNNTYCVRIRRKLLKENKNFKTMEEAIKYKKDKDLEYINILINQYEIPDNIQEKLISYVKVFEYKSDL